MRRWQRAGIAGVLALAALLIRPRHAGEPEPVADMQRPKHRVETKSTADSNDRQPTLNEGEIG